jgi:hypothetical protein
MRWARHVARVEEMRNSYKVLVGKHAVKIYLGEWEDNMKVCGLNSSESVAGPCESGSNESSGSIKGGNFLTSWAIFTRTLVHGIRILRYKKREKPGCNRPGFEPRIFDMGLPARRLKPPGNTF